MSDPDIEINNHPDPNDLASDLEIYAIEAALREAKGRMKRDQEPDKAGVYAVLDCVECGNEIGEGRLRVSIRNTICIECATVQELKAKARR